MAEPITSDLIIGAKSVAAAIGVSVDFVYRAARVGNSPIVKMGNHVVASEAALRRHLMIDAAKIPENPRNEANREG